MGSARASILDLKLMCAIAADATATLSAMILRWSASDQMQRTRRSLFALCGNLRFPSDPNVEIVSSKCPLRSIVETSGEGLKSVR